MKTVGFVTTFIATVLIGLNAGFFYTWSFTIMQSLDLIDPGHAITAMQSINANIRSGWFATIFFGVVAFQFVSLIFVLTARRWWLALLIAIALLAVLVNIGITMQGHVPWNTGLAAESASADGAAQIWSDYSTRWTQWNHLRMLASLVSFCFMLAALMRWNNRA